MSQKPDVTVTLGPVGSHESTRVRIGDQDVTSLCKAITVRARANALTEVDLVVVALKAGAFTAQVNCEHVNVTVLPLDTVTVLQDWLSHHTNCDRRTGANLGECSCGLTETLERLAIHDPWPDRFGA